MVNFRVSMLLSDPALPHACSQPLQVESQYWEYSVVVQIVTKVGMNCFADS